ncbi:MtN3 and saliva related protein [cyanobiont of Ornithocercus magnificus]|nr:MtN3 and saliva related protein [cyanobiont of Ornithocercus magnificus]
MSYPDIYGFMAAVLSTIAFLPQVIKTWRTKKADDVSIVMLLTFIAGLLFWIIYGFQTHALPVLLANTMTLILNVAILALKLIYASDREVSSERGY